VSFHTFGDSLRRIRMVYALGLIANVWLFSLFGKDSFLLT
jgi:hypothetical protein